METIVQKVRHTHSILICLCKVRHTHSILICLCCIIHTQVCCTELVAKGIKETTDIVKEATQLRYIALYIWIYTIKGL